MADEYILKRNALAILMGDKVDLSPNFVPVSMAIDPSSIAKFKDINFTCDRHIDLIKAIPAEDVAPAKKWIPVSERLPEEKCKCLVYKKYTGLSALVSFTNDLESIDEYDFQGQKRWGFFYYDSEYGYCESLGVTHWMPLPEPPKEGT